MFLYLLNYLRCFCLEVLFFIFCNYRKSRSRFCWRWKRHWETDSPPVYRPHIKRRYASSYRHLRRALIVLLPKLRRHIRCWLIEALRTVTVVNQWLENSPRKRTLFNTRSMTSRSSSRLAPEWWFALTIYQDTTICCRSSRYSEG